jgi:transcriptional regulator with XRE-family HTH domain
MNEKIEFSNRLKGAMKDAGYALSATVLEHEFNLRWHGNSISNQAAWSWLNNRTIPTQEKLKILAEWLRVEPDVLRFGNAAKQALSQQQKRWDDSIQQHDREMIDAFLKLPLPQRKVVREVILTFAKAYGV